MFSCMVQKPNKYTGKQPFFKKRLVTYKFPNKTRFIVRRIKRKNCRYLRRFIQIYYFHLPTSIILKNNNLVGLCY